MKFFRLLAIIASVFPLAQAAAIEKGQEDKMLQKRIYWSDEVHQYAATDVYVSPPSNLGAAPEPS
jgi:hypothetical protein